MNVPNVIELAKRHVRDWTFWEIQEIKWIPDMARTALWYPNAEQRTARIEVGWEESHEILWHEIFHSVWADCPLGKLDGSWCEGFCNVFSQTNRGVCDVPRNFPAAEHYADAEKHDGWIRTYGIPEALLAREVDYCPVQFLNFFLRLNQLAADGENPGFLSRFMGYSPMLGIKLTEDRIAYESRN